MIFGGALRTMIAFMRRRTLLPLALCLPWSRLAWAASGDAATEAENAPQTRPSDAVSAAHQGALEVEFALRFEPSDLTLRAHQLRFKRLTLPSLQPAVVAMLNGYGPALSESALLEVVVHHLKPSDLALPSGMGLQPGEITVTDQGLRIGLVPKPLGQRSRPPATSLAPTP